MGRTLSAYGRPALICVLVNVALLLIWRRGSSVPALVPTAAPVPQQAVGCGVMPANHSPASASGINSAMIPDQKS